MNAAQFRNERNGLFFIIGVALLSILSLPLGAYAATTPAPIISATPASVNFSSVKLGGSSLKLVTIKNSGSADLLVGPITFTGTDLSQFGQTNDCSAPLLPKGTCTVSVTFAPTLLPCGNKSATLNIASNDPKRPLLNVKLSGQVPPPSISATPASVNLGSVKLGASSTPHVITVKNTGKSDLIINSVNSTGTDGDEFSQTNNCGTIQSGGSCLVNVTFTPNLPYAKKIAILAIASNDPKKPTATVKLSGQAPPPVISASPMSVNLTAAGLNLPSTAATVKIKNTGVSDLNINSVTITGTNAFLFAATDIWVSQLPSGESCTVGVTFTPDNTGTKSASLLIASDDPKKPLVTVKLTGKTSTDPSVVGSWSVSGTAIVKVAVKGVVKTAEASGNDSLSFYNDSTFSDGGNVFTGGGSPLTGVWSQNNYNYTAIINSSDVEQYFIDYIEGTGVTLMDITVKTMNSKGCINTNGSTIKGKTTLMVTMQIEYQGELYPVTATATYSYISSGFTALLNAEAHVDSDETLNNSLLNKIADEAILSVRGR